jgi:hypothetical protein
MDDEAMVYRVLLTEPATVATRAYSLMTVVTFVTFVVAKVTAETSSPVPQPGRVPVKVSPADRETLK